MNYPPAHTGDDVVEVGEHKVADPYRWLEDVDAPDTQAWVLGQQQLTAAALEPAAQVREQIRARLTELWDFPSWSAPAQHQKRWFQWRNSGLQNQPVLHILSSPTDEGRVLLDPNALSATGIVSVPVASPTKDGALLAYATSEGGADWMTWRIRDVETGEDLPDVVEWSKITGGAWRADGSGFYYSSYPRPTGNELVAKTGVLRVQFHRLGTDAADDPIVFERPDLPLAMPLASVTDDGRFLVVTLVNSGATAAATYVQDLTANEPEWEHLAGDLTTFSMVVGSEGEDFLLLTDVGAPRRRVVRARRGEAPDAWREVVPEGEHMLTQVRHLGGHLVCLYLRHAAAELTVVNGAGELRHRVNLPKCCTVAQLTGA
ncbi:MAG TPA: hypothetical protein VGA36_06100, partial [Nitriliruptorales bacterium]